jgi:DNA-binding MarR family transcriptional regulator
MLVLLKKRHWIQENEGEDRRFRMIRLTAAGRTKLQQSLPYWERAQDRVQRTLGEKTMGQLEGLLAQVAAMTAKA